MGPLKNRAPRCAWVLSAKMPGNHHKREGFPASGIFYFFG